MIANTNSQIGLVLSGGGTRGLAHIGVWQVLEEMKFRPGSIVGCSMGAIVGAMIASGKSATEMTEFVLAQKALSLFQFPVTKLGLATLTKFERKLMDFIGTRRFEGLEMPLIMNATDLTSAQTVVYDRGLLWPAIRASISVPGLFTPIRSHNQVIVDGGVLDEHPFSLLPPHIKRFILVNTTPVESVDAGPHSIVDLLRASMNIMQNEITRLRLAERSTRNYVQIDPELRGRNIVEGVKKFQEIIALGQTAATAKTEEIRRLLESN